MTKDEIKKTLKTCNPTYYNCKICPYKSVEHCVDTMNNDALNLITEQEKEIERLKDDYAKLQELFAQYQIASDKEIMAQKKEAEKRFENNMKAVLEIEKKQAVQDFAEKLKEKARGLTLEGNKGAGFYIGNILLTNDIDELLKEYEK